MSIFQDNVNVYASDGSWHSSPWLPYYYKPTSRYVASRSGDALNLKIWCNEPEWSGHTIYIKAAHGSSTDIIDIVGTDGASGSHQESDNYNFGSQASLMATSELAHDDRTLKHWFAPGIALQLPDGTSSTSVITQDTVWEFTPDDSWAREKVYDGGVHCWVKFPYNTVASASTTLQENVYTKIIPREFLGNNDFFLIFNTAGHQIRRRPSSTDNVAFTMKLQAGELGDTPETWIDYQTIFNDTDIQDNTGNGTSSGLNSKFMAQVWMNDTECVKNGRFHMYNPDAAGNEDRLLRSQFIRLSVYPMPKQVEE
jgi:hypothetical protein